MSANAPCPNCGRINRPGAKRCASCGNVLPAPSASPVPPPPPQQPPRQQPAPPPPPPQQMPRQQTPPPPPPQQLPRQQPAPPQGGPTPLPPPRKPTPPPQKPVGKSRLPLKPWQIAAIGGGIVILCLCLLIANALNGMFGSKATPTTTYVTVPPYVSPTFVIVTATQAPIVVTVAPTQTPIIITATPAPVTQTPSVTPVPPTQLPTATTEPSRTPTAQPTMTTPPTATAVPTPTLAPDTLITSTLEVGQTWRQQNMAMTLSNTRFADVTCDSIMEFDLDVTNNEPTELVIAWRGEDMSVLDNQGKPYDVFYQPAPRTNDCGKYVPIKSLYKNALASKENFKIAVQVRGQLPLPDAVKEFIVTVVKAGRIQNAKWRIPVPR